MGEILGIGVSHYPPLSGIDADMAGLLRGRLEDPAVPAEAKDPAGWPELMRAEWGTDQGVEGAAKHRAAMIAGFEECRRAIDDFNPDVVVIWGDDQYENFREDLIPPFSILAYPDLVLHPWQNHAKSSTMDGRQNVWGESADTELEVKGSPEVARWLVTELLNQGIDVSYAYTPSHHPGLAHAFLNTILYLDYHRKGFPYPVIPFPLNAYGSRVVCQKGYAVPFDEKVVFDPPSPPPWRMMQVGAAVARSFRDSDLRVALIASSSWSHAFMVDHTWRLRPDVDADREMYHALIDGDLEVWRTRTLAQLDYAGQQELLNWYAMIGAMEELGRTRPDWSTMVETYVFNSSKIFTVYQP